MGLSYNQVWVDFLFVLLALKVIEVGIDLKHNLINMSW